MRVSVIGAGGWGTALAVHIASHNPAAKVTLWARTKQAAEKLTHGRENARYLPGVYLPASVAITHNLEEAVQCTSIIMAVPSQAFHDVASALHPFTKPGQSLLIATKGLEAHTGRRLSVVLHDCLPQVPRLAIATLSGPNHAEEVGRNIPTASVVASTSPETAVEWQDLLTTPTFRVYVSTDVVGVELAGAVKNIIAIAVGICDGLAYGDNTKAAVITRGLTEMIRLGKHLDAEPLTFAGLAGLGDLVATCYSHHSRNRAAGEHIGSGVAVATLLHSSDKVIEGVAACQAVHHLASQLNIDMPITNAVHRILFAGEDPRSCVAALMNRDPKGELESIFGPRPR